MLQFLGHVASQQLPSWHIGLQLRVSFLHHCLLLIIPELATNNEPSSLVQVSDRDVNVLVCCVDHHLTHWRVIYQVVQMSRVLFHFIFWRLLNMIFQFFCKKSQGRAAFKLLFACFASFFHQQAAKQEKDRGAMCTRACAVWGLCCVLTV